jgi:trk/ktr system potassium uptake protein
MGVHALTYAIRGRVISTYLGQLCVVLAGLASVPLLVSLWFGDTTLSIRYAIVIGLLVIIGGLLSRINAPSRLQSNEAMVIVSLVFLFGPLLMTYPMMSSGLAFSDALFETISAVTTTGLSTLPTVETKSDTFLFARAWMQWYGGLGIVVFSLVLLIQPGMTAKDLSVMEGDPDDLVGSTRKHAYRTLIVYCAITACGIGLLTLTGIGLFSSITLTFGAISTGGFAPVDTSVSLNPTATQVGVGIICMAGAVPLVYYHHLYLRKEDTGTSTSQLYLLFLCASITTVLFALSTMKEGNLFSFELWHHAWFQAVSAQSSAGFSSLDIPSLDSTAKLSLMPAMAIGGGIGSTAGGIKLFRILLLLRLLYMVVVRAATTRQAVVYPTLGGRRLHDQEIQASLLFILLFLLVLAVSWVPFVVMGYDPIDSLFEVISATGTTGLTAGISQSQLPLFLKGILCADMLLGRLEIIAWLILVYPGTWIGRRAETK